MADSTPTDFDLINDPTRHMLGSAWEPLTIFAQMLIDEGELRGLIGTRELPRLWSRHIVNSAVLEQFLPQQPHTVADVGTGAGFPGVVLALMRPDVQFTFIESMERRCEWLELVRQRLEMTNVHIARNRSEDVHDTFDVVTSRAVAKMSKLVTMTGHLVTPGGRFLALKGQRAQIEVDAARKQLRRAQLVNVTVHDIPSPMDDSLTRVVVADKRKK